jgi:SAM-dependent methyltransferase
MCGLRFFSPRLSEDWIMHQVLNEGLGKAAIERSFRTGTMVEPAPLSAEKQKLFNKNYYTQKYNVARHYSQRDHPRVLDVGCGAGWGIKTYLDCGAHPASCATDSSPHAYQYTKKQGVSNVIPGIFREITIPDRTFDIVFANDFIEHTYTPLDDLHKMRRVVRDAGVLFIKTFNETADEAAGRTMLRPPDHSHHFTPEVLVNLLTSAGWRVVDIIYQGVMMEIYCRPNLEVVK